MNKADYAKVREYQGFGLYLNLQTGRYEVRSTYNWKLRGNPSSEGQGHNMLRNLARHTPMLSDH